MTVTAGYKSDVYITSTPSVSMTNEATTADATRELYTITDSLKRYWDDSAAFVIETSPDGTTWSAAAGYTLQYVGGVVVFGSAQSVGTQIRVTSGKYFPFSKLANGTEWDISVDMNLVDVTKFGDVWKLQLPLQKSGSAKVNSYFVDGTFLSYLGSKMILILYVDATSTTRYETFAYLTNESIKTVATGVIEDDLSFEISGPVYFVP